MNQLLRIVLATATLGGLGLAGCQNPMDDAAAVRREVRADEAQWNADDKSRTLEKITAHYSPDGTLMMPGTPLASGAGDLRKALAALLSDPALHVRFAADKVGLARHNDLAYARGPFTFTVTDPRTGTPVTETGTYITIYRKQADGSWKAIERIFSQGATAPAPND